jgi:hypothetical protein
VAIVVMSGGDGNAASDEAYRLKMQLHDLLMASVPKCIETCQNNFRY